MKHIFYTAALAAMILSGCMQEKEQPATTEGYKTVTLDVAITKETPQGKAIVADDGKFAWETTDVLGVNVNYTDNGGNVSDFFRFTCVEANGNSATFKGQIPQSGTVAGVAVYPYSDSDTWDGSRLSVTLNEGSVSTVANPKMVAKIAEGASSLSFSPLSGLVKLTYSNVPATASSLYLTSDRPICGVFNVDMDDLSISAGESNSTSTSLAFTSPAEKGTSVSLYAQLPAGDHNISAELRNASGEAIRGTECSLDKAVAAAAGQITCLPAIELPHILYYETVKIYGTDNTLSSLPALAYHNDEFWCVFREGAAASGSDGKLKVMKSRDASQWETVQDLEYTNKADMSEGLAFNSTNNTQFMYITHHEDFDFTADESFSITAWMKTSETAYSQIVSTRQGGNGYDFAVQSNHLIVDFGNPYLRAEATEKSLTANEWHHVAFSYNGEDKSVALYLDGEKQTFTTTATCYPQTGFNGQANTFGNHIFVMTKANKFPSVATGSSANSNTGSLKTLRFWSKALSSGEVKADMTAEVTSSTSGLIAGYDFTQASTYATAGSVVDIKGAHPGTLSGISVNVTSSPGEVREANLLNAPDGRLMIAATGVKYNGSTIIGRETISSFLPQGASEFGDFTSGKIYKAENELHSNPILWSPRFHGNSIYGVDYSGTFALYRSDDYGKTYNKVCDLDRNSLDGPNEVALAWNTSGQLYTFIRNNGNAYVGISDAPYTSHTYSRWGLKLEGASVVAYNDDIFLIAARTKNDSNSNVIRVMSSDGEGNIIYSSDLPCGGDMGHPCLVVKGKDIYVSYHSSHEGKTSVYLSRLPLEDFVTPAE